MIHIISIWSYSRLQRYREKSGQKMCFFSWSSVSLLRPRTPKAVYNTTRHSQFINGSICDAVSSTIKYKYIVNYDVPVRYYVFYSMYTIVRTRSRFFRRRFCHSVAIGYCYRLLLFSRATSRRSDIRYLL